ncbi:g5894 [Coccomyxa viridis]|uniref:G5894 protein n=1 Tax=Coccomyxa viridis TaxID=1274662 RepID=A0ABP1FWK0_9CHLO
MDGAFPSAKGEGFEQGADWPEQRRGFRGNAENAKTKLCMRWKNGHCRFGDRCNFAHGEEELRRLPARGNGFGQGPGSYAGGEFPGGGFEAPGQGGTGPGFGSGAGFRAGGVGGAFGSGMGGAQMGGVYGGGNVRPGPAHTGLQSAQQQIPYARQGPDGWTEYRAQDGQFYYFNHHTKENTWDKPACWP